MTDKEKENRINSLAVTFLSRQQIRPNIFADQIMRAYKEGYHQAEKDLELSWGDIKEICDITFEEACRLQRNMKSSHIYKEKHYQEVLKRFKERKEK